MAGSCLTEAEREGDGTDAKQPVSPTTLKLIPIPVAQDTLSREAHVWWREGEGGGGWQGVDTMFKVQVGRPDRDTAPNRKQLETSPLRCTQRLLCPMCPSRRALHPALSVLSLPGVLSCPACQRWLGQDASTDSSCHGPQALFMPRR